MDPVSGLTRIMEILRQQVSRDTKIQKKAGPTKPAPTARGGRRPSVQELEQRVAERIRALDPQDAEHAGKAARVFLESVLAWEFGDEILEDARLAEIVAKLQSDLLTEPRLNAGFSRMLEQLSSR